MNHDKLVDMVVMLIATGGAKRDTAETIIAVVRAETGRSGGRPRSGQTPGPRRTEIGQTLRFQVLQRDGFKCRYCGATADSAELTMDHVVPVARGGKAELSNLVTACDDCNRGKGFETLAKPLTQTSVSGFQDTAPPAASNTHSEKISVSADLQKEVDTLFLRGDSDTPPPVSKSAADSGVPAAPSPETKPLRRARSAGQACPPGEGVLTFPCAGEPKEWSLSKSQLAEWSALYQGLDVLLECKKALAWIRANHVKTAAGMPRFLVNWLSRTQNRGGASRPAPKPYREMPYLKRPEPQ